MCNLNEDLIDYIAGKIPGVGEFKVDMSYSTLPDACFACKGRGHIARYCPNKPQPLPKAKKTNTITKGVADKGKGVTDTDGFKEVPTKKMIKEKEKQSVAPPDKRQNMNRFVALEEEPIKVSDDTLQPQQGAK